MLYNDFYVASFWESSDNLRFFSLSLSQRDTNSEHASRCFKITLNILAAGNEKRIEN